jgi:hypothetical protein
VEVKSKEEYVKQRNRSFAEEDNEAKKCIRMTCYMEKTWAGHAEGCEEKARKVPPQLSKKANVVNARRQSHASKTARLPHLETVQAMQWARHLLGICEHKLGIGIVMKLLSLTPGPVSPVGLTLEVDSTNTLRGTLRQYSPGDLIGSSDTETMKVGDRAR